MSWQRGINEIASLLTQGGVPSNHAAEIAARLSYSIQDFYDSRQAQGNSQELNSSSPRTAAYRSAFRSPESYPKGQPGAAGKDGQYAWASGADGKDGQQGDAGQDGTGQDGASGLDGAAGAAGAGINLAALRKLLEELKGKDGKDAKLECPGGGAFPKGDICSILKQQAIEIGKQRRELNDLKSRVEALEKKLKDTVACP
jgi:hypothetical protein